MFTNRLSLAFLLLAALAGCSPQNKLETTIVTGIVKVDGQPMEGIAVLFQPTVADANPAVGATDNKGAFKLSTPGGVAGKGTIPGSYIPTFSKDELEKREAASVEEYQKKYGGSQPQTIHHLPTKYADVKTCGVAPVTVEQGKKNHFEFELSKTE